jgi:hypothetical protein
MAKDAAFGILKVWCVMALSLFTVNPNILRLKSKAREENP